MSSVKSPFNIGHSQLSQIADAFGQEKSASTSSADLTANFSGIKNDNGISRRDFLQTISLSLLIGSVGLCGCRRPEEKIIPFSGGIDGFTPGEPEYYATAMPTQTSAIPLLVKAYDGRPVKIEGNPLIDYANGGTDLFAQASLLGFYDPDRLSKYIVRNANSERIISKDDAICIVTSIADSLLSSKGDGFCVLMTRSSSPSRQRLISEILDKLPLARFFVYEPIDLDLANTVASKHCKSQVKLSYHFDRANVILSIDSDFLGGEEDTARNIASFTRRRKISTPRDEMNRLYSIESAYTLTGANADHRLNSPPSLIPAVTAAIALETLKDKHNIPASIVQKLVRLSEPAKKYNNWIKVCAGDLVLPDGKPDKKGSSLVLAGHRQSELVHSIAMLINFALGSFNSTISVLENPDSINFGNISELALLLENKKVKTLLIVGCNPVYDAPPSLQWAKLQTRAQQVVRLAEYDDETAALSNLVIPMAHFLESWGDARTSDGVLVGIQPISVPLHNGMSELELLARLASHKTVKPYDIARDTFFNLVKNDEAEWQNFVRNGFAPGTEFSRQEFNLDWGLLESLIDNALKDIQKADGYALVLQRSYRMDDGRYANNLWLQETADPITKIVWDNVALVNLQTAKKLGLKKYSSKADNSEINRGRIFLNGVEISVNGNSIKAPLMIQPGIADNTICLELGYGRAKCGRIATINGDKSVGYNAYKLRASAGSFFLNANSVKLLDETFEIASVQSNGLYAYDGLIVETTLQTFSKQPDFVKNSGLDEDNLHRRDNLDSQSDSNKTAGGLCNPLPLNGIHQWGMVIDLNACIGCGVCALSCRSENNIPVVGKEQVARGREMDWLRIDRYYVGNLSNPRAAFQPVACLHCEDAPCEYVCPVNATVHDNEGLNLMVYNRCIGARYCLNNCPYKARRFNYLDYNRRFVELYKNFPCENSGKTKDKINLWQQLFGETQKHSESDEALDLIKMLRNPEVTVRMRGIMEKCTYCIQRIQEAKAHQKITAGSTNDIKVPDGYVKTACQQACPAQAIVFGDLNNPDSQVSKAKNNIRAYALLGHLSTRPRTVYLAKIRNPNPLMPDIG